MATTYDVGLRWTGGAAAKAAIADANAVRESLGALEAKTVTARGGGRSNVAREQAAQARAAAQQVRISSRAEAQRNREETQFSAYRIRLMRKEVAEREQAEKAMLAAELRRIREAQAAEQRAMQARRRTQQQTRGNAAGVFGAAIGGAVLGGAAIGGAALAYGGKEVFNTASKIEQAKLRLTALLGSEKAAADEIQDMVRAAAKTKFDWQDLVDATSSLSASFKDTSERRFVLARVSDMVTGSGGGKEQMDQVILAINQMAGKGKVEQEELNQIIEPLKGIVSRKDYAVEVGRLLGIKGKDDADLVAKVAKLQKAGSISSNTGIQAILNAGGNKIGGGAGGSFAVKMGDTLEGIVSNIRTGLSTMFAGANVEKWPGLVALKNALADIAKMFEVDSPAGKKFGEMLSQLSSMVTPVIVLAKDLFGLTMALTQNQTLMELVGRGIRQLAAGMLIAGAAVGGVITGVLALAGGIEWLLEKVARFVIYIGPAMYDVGRQIVLGIAAGITGAAGAVYDALGNLAGGAVGALKDKLRIHSPSRVMFELGGYTSEGYARGIESGAGRVARAGEGLAAGAAGGVQVQAGGSGSVVMNVSFRSAISGVADPAAAAQQLSDMEVAKFATLLQRVTGRFVAQGTA